MRTFHSRKILTHAKSALGLAIYHFCGLYWKLVSENWLFTRESSLLIGFLCIKPEGPFFFCFFLWSWWFQENFSLHEIFPNTILPQMIYFLKQVEGIINTKRTPNHKKVITICTSIFISQQKLLFRSLFGMSRMVLLQRNQKISVKVFGHFTLIDLEFNVSTIKFLFRLKFEYVY